MTKKILVCDGCYHRVHKTKPFHAWYCAGADGKKMPTKLVDEKEVRGEGKHISTKFSDK